MSYGKLSQLLHRLALNSDLRCEVFFDVERSVYGKALGQSDNHVFVCGLARAGTTIAMRSLYETGHFSSLTYRDMPFLLMPNLWKTLSSIGQKNIEKTERAHGDGIEVDFDSPEGFEEVFWRVHTCRSYIGEDSLSEHDIEQPLIEKFREYVALINLRCGKTRYLSKNNNNILRIKSLMDAFPASHIVIPFRHPLAQSASLLRQHQLFLRRHREDTFSKRYMSWLVHHEFGADQKRFCLGDVEVDRHANDSASRDYWLTQWINVYTSLVAKYTEERNVIFVCYEDLCCPTLGGVVWERLSSTLGIPVAQTDFRAAQSNNDRTGVESLADRAIAVYEQMRELSAARLGYSTH
jgi:hypothetical protein